VKASPDWAALGCWGKDLDGAGTGGGGAINEPGGGTGGGTINEAGGGAATGLGGCEDKGSCTAGRPMCEILDVDCSLLFRKLDTNWNEKTRPVSSH
jgi:hypothetical protein